MRPSDQGWPFAFNVGKIVRENLQVEMPASAIKEGALRARATFERINHRKRPSWRPWFISAATMGAAAAVLLWVVTRPITFVVKHGQQHAGGFVRSGAGQAAEVLFSDGTRLTIAAGGIGRVQDVSARGASVRLEGELSANVVHRRATGWRFDAGPFSIAVTGTAFDLRWSGDAQELDLTMRSGTVVVDGPLTPYLALRQGQHLQVRLRQGLVVIREQAPIPQTEPPAVLPPRNPLQPVGAAPRLKKPAQPSWTNFLAQGKFSSIVTEAEQAGVRCL